MTSTDLEVQLQEQLVIDSVEAQEIEARLRAELVSYTREQEVAHVLEEIETETSPQDEHFGTPFYNTTLRERHKKQRQRRDDAILDPGGQKLKNIARRRNPRLVESDQKRYAQRVAEATGQDVDVVIAEKQAMRAERAVKRALKSYLMNHLGYSDSGARKHLGALTNEQEAEIQRAARDAGYSPETCTHGAGRSGPECLGVSEQSSAALPVRDSELSDSCDSDKVHPSMQRIVIERDIDKSAIREQLARDTQAFLDAGGGIEVLEPWYPADKHCLFIGGKKHIKSTWGYVPMKTAKGRPGDYDG